MPASQTFPTSKNTAPCRAFQMGKAEFEVGLQPQVAELAFEAGVPSLGGVAWSEGSHRPAAHAVAASHVEHAVHREGGGVAVGESDAAEEPVGHGRPVSYRDGIADIGIHAEILRVADAEYFVECFVPWAGSVPPYRSRRCSPVRRRARRAWCASASVRLPAVPALTRTVIELPLPVFGLLKR